MSSYADQVKRTATQTPQNIKAKPDQKKNHAGGFVFPVDMWAMLDRFVVLGSDRNSYYSSAKDQTNENYESLIECITEDGIRTVKRIVEISDAGRAPKNASAVFALAVCAAYGDKMTKETAFRSMPAVARTATDFFAFIDAYKKIGGGFGVVARKGIAAWYQDKEISNAAYQIIKYRQRNGWTHLDALRLSHAKPRNEAESNLFAFAKSLAGHDTMYNVDMLPQAAQGYLSAQTTSNVSDIVKLIVDHRLPREAIPTNFLNEVAVWEALLQNMPATALIRNLGKMSSIGLFDGAKNANTKLVVDRFNDAEWIRKSRMHPVTILNALYVFQQGHGVLGSLTWKPIPRIIDALDAAFYHGFANVESTGKRFMLALDVSGSMAGHFGGTNPSFQLPPREISAAMAMATARVEEDYIVTYFSSGNASRGRGMYGRGDSGISTIGLSPRQRLDDVVKSISRLPWGGTDCALPMIWAEKQKEVIDTFVVYTDNETWAGSIHPFEALKSYRKAVNPDAQLVVCSCLPSQFSIADPSDAGMMDIVGFDANVPALIADFAQRS